MLVGPDPVRFRLPRNALDVAVAVSVDLRSRPGSADERIVLRNGAIISQANDRACVIGKILRAWPVPAISKGDIQQASMIE